MLEIMEWITTNAANLCSSVTVEGFRAVVIVSDDTPRPSPICPEFVPEGGDKTASPIRTIAA